MLTVVESLRGRYDRTRRWLRAGRAGLLLLRDPSRLADVFELDDAASEPATVRAAADALRRAPSCAQALHERPRLGHVDLERLRGLPPGTLGRAFADFLDAARLDPNVLRRHADANDEPSYIEAHLYETHDLWHVATGFGVDVAGELGVQAFYAAQVPGTLPPLLVTGGLLQALFFERVDWTPRLEAIARGYTLGKRARPLFGVRWAELWTTPLTDVRKALGLPVGAPEPD